RVVADQASASGRRDSRRPRRVVAVDDGKARIRGGISDDFLELLPRERVGAGELVGGGSRLDRAREERRDRGEPEGEHQEAEENLDEGYPCLPRRTPLPSELHGVSSRTSFPKRSPCPARTCRPARRSRSPSKW